jgi:AcrR family transcriptional regulator
MAKQRSVQQPRAKRTREDLLQAARRVFASLGYAGATIDGVTAAAGVSKGAFYFHFDSKEDVLVALVTEWTSDVSGQVRELAKGASFEQGGLRPIIDGLLSVGGTPWQPRLLLEFVAQAAENERVAEAMVSAQDAWRTATAKIIGKARRAGLVGDGLSPDATASMLLAIREGLIMQACLPGANSGAAVRVAAKAALSLLQPVRDLRRAG